MRSLVGTAPETDVIEGPLSLQVVFSYSSKATRILVHEAILSFANEFKQHIVFNPTTQQHDVTFQYRAKRAEWQPLKVQNVLPYKFYDVMPATGQATSRGHYIELIKDRLEQLTPKEGSGPVPDELLGFLYPRLIFGPQGLGSIVEFEFRKLFYVGPLREFPKRVYTITGQAPEDVGTKGEKAPDVLWYSHRSEKKDVHRVERNGSSNLGSQQILN